MEYQWYPGHMTKARRMMQENIALIDLLIELTDARAPQAGRNPDIDTLAKGKSRIVVLNKADLADAAATKAWRAHFEEKGFLTADIDSRKGSGVRALKPLIDRACQEKLEAAMERKIRECRLNADLEEKLQIRMERRLSDARNQMKIFAARLEQRSPLAKLAGGYGYVSDESGSAVLSVDKVQIGDLLNIQLKDGKIMTTVNHIDPSGD